MAAVSRARVIAIKVNAGNDRNGNPRRGWLVYSTKGSWFGFVDEGFEGRQALTSRFPAAVDVVPTLATTPKQYKDLLKQKEISGLSGAFAGFFT